MSDETLDFKKIEDALKTNNDELKRLIEKANNDVEEHGKTAHDTKQGLDVVSKKCEDLTLKLAAMEQKMRGGSEDESSPLSLGEQFIKSDGFAAMIKGGQKTARMTVKTAIINATGQNQPLVPAQRLPGIQHEPNRILRIRDMLPTATTSSNLIEYVRENVFTNSAGPQYNSGVVENVTKPESAITFTMEHAPVITISHWIPASKQVLDDSKQLQSYINTRLLYGLAFEEEDEILNGDGTSGKLNGIINQATDDALTISNETPFDVIRKAITKAELSNYFPDAILLNPSDVQAMDLVKETTGGYVASDPRQSIPSTVWGLPIIKTNSIAANSYLLGSFQQGAQIWDREQSSVEVSREDGSNFVKNMVTILAEERLALTVYRPAAFIKGNLS